MHGQQNIKTKFFVAQIPKRAQISFTPRRKPEITYLRIDFRYLQIHTSSMRNVAMLDLVLIKLTVARFVGTGSFLIIYSNGHTK